MMGLVQRGEADFSAHAFVMTKQRKHYVDFGVASPNPYNGALLLFTFRVQRHYLPQAVDSK